MCKPIWVIGEYILDLGVDIDFATLYAMQPKARDRVRATARGIDVRPGSRIVVTSKTGATVFDISPQDAADDWIHLQFGEKYQLAKPPELAQGQEEIRDTDIQLSFLDGRWGGGGYNVCSALRSLCPNPAAVPIRFTALGRAYELEQLAGNRSPDGGTHQREEYLRGLLSSFAELAESVEWSLHRDGISFDFIRSAALGARTNLVIQQVRSPDFPPTSNRIILKCPPSEPTAELTADELRAFVSSRLEASSVVLINSLSSKRLFEALVDGIVEKMDPYESGHRPQTYILAMTEANLGHIGYLLKAYDKSGAKSNAGKRLISFFHLLFNEKEFPSFLASLRADSQLNSEELELYRQLREDALDPVTLFKGLSKVHDKQERTWPVFVTTGPYGSIAISGQTLYIAGPYSKASRPIIDTTGAGDAWAAAVCLQYHLLHTKPDLVHFDPMQFMAFASAVAGAKVANRLGKLNLSEIEDFVNSVHIKYFQRDGFMASETSNEQRKKWDLRPRQSKEMRAEWMTHLFRRTL